MINPVNVSLFSQFEDQADENGRGSVWRACLAVQRSCKNNKLSALIGKLNRDYCTGNNKVLGRLKKIYCSNIKKSEGEFAQALEALKLAVEEAPRDKPKIWLINIPRI